MDALQSTTNHSVQAELRERTEQLNQLWLGCQRQFAEMKRFICTTFNNCNLSWLRALGDIGNVVRTRGVPVVEGKPLPNLPITRRYYAQLLANAQESTEGSDCVHPFVALQSCIKTNPDAFSKDAQDEPESPKEVEDVEYKIIVPSWSKEQKPKIQKV